MIKIPTNSKKFIQDNKSDLTGNVFMTKNITFDYEGYMKLSHSPRCIMSPTVDADWDNLGAVVYNSYKSNFLLLTWDELFDLDTRFMASYPTQNTDTGVVSGGTKIGACIADSKIIVAQNTDVDYYDLETDTWVDTNITLTNDGQHQVVNFISLASIAICNVNTVLLYSTPFSSTPVLSQTLTIPSDYEIMDACYLNQKMFITTRNIRGGHACLFVWNGSGNGAQEVYEVNSNIIFGITQWKNTVALFTGAGELLYYTGGGLSPIQNGRFPIWYKNQNLTDYDNISLYKNLLKSNGDLLYINISNDQNNRDLLLNQPDGIWCYDENVGLYHRYSNTISLMDIKTVNSTGINTTTDIITTTNVPVTGTAVILSDKLSAGTIGGVTKDTVYYVIKVSSTEMKLATTKANAVAGTYIDLTSVSAGGYGFVCFPNIDYGTFLSSRAFSTYVLEIPSAYPQYGVDTFWSSEVDSRQLSSSNDEHLIAVSPVLESRGYYISPKILAQNITDTYNNFSIKFKKLASELDKIIIKYRVTDDNFEKIDIGSSETNWRATWTSSTTFTSTQTDLANAREGDEIEFLSGAAGGLLTHITNITENSGTYTITIDETYENYTSGDLSRFIFRNWKKFATISYGSGEAEDGYFSKQLGATGKFIQFKIELRGIGVQIEELQINNKTHLPS